MPSLTPNRRFPAALAALAILGALSFAAPAQADELTAPSAETIVAPPAEEQAAPAEEQAPAVEEQEAPAAEELTEPASTETETTETESTGEELVGNPSFALARIAEPAALAEPVTPIACVASGGWAASDASDVPAQVTAAGLVFTGQAKSVNYYQRVSQGNAQGITGMSYTVSSASGPYAIQMKVEIFRNGTSGYSTLSSLVPVGSTGAIDPLAYSWYATNTTGPGSMSQPLPWADLIALYPDNALLSAPSIAMQSSGTGSSATVTAVSSSCGSTTFPQVVAPVACVAAPTWAASDVNDVIAELTATGLVFNGQTKSVNYYQRPATVSNAQGITGMTYTIAPGATGFGVQLKVEVNPRANLGGGALVSYATLSTIQVPAPPTLTGTIDAQASLWYTNKITSGPGSMASPLPWSQLIALMPNNSLLSTPSLHMQTGASAADHAVVTSISSSCGASNFVTPPVVEPLSCPAVTAITGLAALDLSSNSTDGSSTTVLQAAGLHVTTAATGHRKAAGYVTGVGWQPLDSVTDFVLQWTGTASRPGGQLPVDLDGDDVADGILVIEPINGGVQWLSVPAGGTWVTITGAPHAVGGGGYPNQGTFAEWIAAYPDAQWTSPGYSLGSGVTGDGVIGSLTVVGSGNCAYTFGLPAVVTPPAGPGTTPPSTTPGTATPAVAAAAAPVPTSTPTPEPTASATPAPTDTTTTTTDELPTEAFGGESTGDAAPWWPWAVGAGILLLLLLLWFLVFRKRFGAQP